MQKLLKSILMTCLLGLAIENVTAVEVARYEFEGNADDSVTSDGAQNLTLFGDAVVTSPGIIGEGKLSFDGSGDYATASGTNGFTSGVPAVTLSTWFTTATIMSNTQHVLIQMPITGGASLAQSAVGLEISSGKLQVGGRSATSEGFQFNDATLPSNELVLSSTTIYFAAAVIDYANDMVTAYLFDGTEWKTQPVDVTFTNDFGPGNLGLSMDDVRIFTHALSEAELQAMAGFEPPPSGNGDFDGDGDVDGRDFLIWQRGQSPNSLSAEDLAAWQENYGVGSLSAAVTAVPEPTVAVLLCSVVAGMSLCRRPF
jgi:hypothetical protein